MKPRKNLRSSFTEQLYPYLYGDVFFWFSVYEQPLGHVNIGLSTPVM